MSIDKICFSANGRFEVRALPLTKRVRLEYTCDEPLELEVHVIDRLIQDLYMAKERALAG